MLMHYPTTSVERCTIIGGSFKFEAEIYVKKLHVSDFADLILKMKTFEEMKDILFEAEDYAFATMKNK